MKTPGALGRARSPAAYGVRWSGSRFYLNNLGIARSAIAADAVISAGSTMVTSSTAGFKAADVGLAIIEDNYLSGGGFTFYSIQSRSAPQFGVPTNVTVRNNTFGSDHLFDYATVGGNVVWSGNVNESGQTVTPRRDQ